MMENHPSRNWKWNSLTFVLIFPGWPTQFFQCFLTWLFAGSGFRAQCYMTFYYCNLQMFIISSGNAKKGIITVPLTSCLTGLESTV